MNQSSIINQHSHQVLIIAGEKSAEEHAMGFLPALKERFPHLSFWGVGGDDLKGLGVELIYHLKDFSSMGFSEVIGKIPFYFKALKEIVFECQKRKTTYAILIDFQGFNLKLAQRLHAQGVKVIYYVAPQAWAWKAYRADILAKCVFQLYCILPFEKEWFEKRGVRQAISITHPIVERYRNDLKVVLNNKKNSMNKVETPKRLLLLPGSRKFEVSEILPEFIGAIKLLKKSYDLQVGIVKSSNLNEQLFRPYDEQIDIQFQHHDLPKALDWADMALATSGTVTLTCGLFAVPTVVAYKTSLFNEFIFHTFINYQGPISLTNLVDPLRPFPELTQEHASSFNLAGQIEKWLQDPQQYKKIKQSLFSMSEYLGIGQETKKIVIETFENLFKDKDNGNN